MRSVCAQIRSCVKRYVSLRLQALLRGAERQAINRQSLEFLESREIARPAIGQDDHAVASALQFMRELADEFFDAAEVRVKGAGE